MPERVGALLERDWTLPEEGWEAWGRVVPRPPRVTELPLLRDWEPYERLGEEAEGRLWEEP